MHHVWLPFFALLTCRLPAGAGIPSSTPDGMARGQCTLQRARVSETDRAGILRTPASGDQTQLFSVDVFGETVSGGHAPMGTGPDVSSDSREGTMPLPWVSAALNQETGRQRRRNPRGLIRELLAQQRGPRRRQLGVQEPGDGGATTVPRDLEVGQAIRCPEGQRRTVLLEPGRHIPSRHPSIRAQHDDGSTESSAPLESLAVRGQLSLGLAKSPVQGREEDADVQLGTGLLGSGREHAGERHSMQDCSIVSDWLLAKHSQGSIRDLHLLWSGGWGGKDDRAGNDLPAKGSNKIRATGGLFVLIRIWGGPWEIKSCSLSCGGDPIQEGEGGRAGQGLGGCVLLCSLEAKCVVTRCSLGPIPMPHSPGGLLHATRETNLWYGVLCMGRSVTELRRSTVMGAEYAGVSVEARAAALVSRCSLNRNAFGLWVAQHGHVRLRLCMIVRCSGAPLFAQSEPESFPTASNAVGTVTRGCHVTVEHCLFDNVPWSGGSRPDSLNGEGNRLMLFRGDLGVWGRWPEPEEEEEEVASFARGTSDKQIKDNFAAFTTLPQYNDAGNRILVALASGAEMPPDGHVPIPGGQSWLPECALRTFNPDALPLMQDLQKSLHERDGEESRKIAAILRIVGVNQTEVYAHFDNIRANGSVALEAFGFQDFVNASGPLVSDSSDDAPESRLMLATNQIQQRASTRGSMTRGMRRELRNIEPSMTFALSLLSRSTWFHSSLQLLPPVVFSFALFGSNHSFALSVMLIGCILHRFRKVRPSVGSCKMALPGNRRARLRNPFHKLIQVNPGAVTHSPGQVDTLDQKSKRTANSQIHSADDILAPWACVALDSLLARHDLALLATARRLAPSPMQSF